MNADTSTPKTKAAIIKIRDDALYPSRNNLRSISVNAANMTSKLSYLEAYATGIYDIQIGIIVSIRTATEAILYEL